ncbi:hypothetical protein ACKKBG_A13795 [Auxenochlorella protothecoides x Auxenochlorella symbiontica]
MCGSSTTSHVCTKVFNNKMVSKSQQHTALRMALVHIAELSCQHHLKGSFSVHSWKATPRFSLSRTTFAASRFRWNARVYKEAGAERSAPEIVAAEQALPACLSKCHVYTHVVIYGRPGIPQFLAAVQC